MEKQGSRALLAAVIGMGIVLAVGSLVLVGVLVHRISHPRATAPATIPAPAAVTAPVTTTTAVLPQDLGRLVLDEPAGTHVTSIARQADMALAVALTGGGADRVIIWDLAHNRIIGRLQVSP